VEGAFQFLDRGAFVLIFIYIALTVYKEEDYYHACGNDASWFSAIAPCVHIPRQLVSSTLPWDLNKRGSEHGSHADTQP